LQCWIRAASIEALFDIASFESRERAAIAPMSGASPETEKPDEQWQIAPLVRPLFDRHRAALMLLR